MTAENPWPFEAPRNQTSITTQNVLAGWPILLVTHDEDDGGWQFLCGTTNEPEDGRVVGLGCMVEGDPSLLELADLPEGWLAWRESSGAIWHREPNPQAEPETPEWQVVLIPEDEEGPAFAFTVGLYRLFQHPEILMMGLGLELMHRILNNIGDDVRGGRTYSEGEEAADILENCSCAFRRVHRDHYREYLGSAIGYYESEEFPALQCFWPDKRDRLPWDQNFDEERAPLQALLFQSS